jgi:RimJ/RimL family protein N-acetyltransferase
MSDITLTSATLRPWRPGDAGSLVRHANNREVSRNLRDSFPFPYTEADAHAWLSGRVGEAPPLNLAIEVDGEAAGGIGVHTQDDVFRRSAEIGYWLGQAHWDRGIMTEAVVAMSDYAFATLDIVRLFAGVFSSNPASARVLEKAGYQLEGRLRAAVTKDGETLDQLLYALVREG